MQHVCPSVALHGPRARQRCRPKVQSHAGAPQEQAQEQDRSRSRRRSTDNFQDFVVRFPAFEPKIYMQMVGPGLGEDPVGTVVPLSLVTMAFLSEDPASTVVPLSLLTALPMHWWIL